jgi:hypothetical protein
MTDDVISGDDLQLNEWGYYETKPLPRVGTARLLHPVYVAELPGASTASLYELDPPHEGYAFVVVVGVWSPTLVGTTIQPANRDGSLADAGHLRGGFAGAMDHVRALNNAGYDVVL